MGWGVTALGSPLRITHRNMEEDLYQKELFFSYPYMFKKFKRKQLRPLPDHGPT